LSYSLESMIPVSSVMYMYIRRSLGPTPVTQSNNALVIAFFQSTVVCRRHFIISVILHVTPFSRDTRGQKPWLTHFFFFRKDLSLAYKAVPACVPGPDPSINLPLKEILSE
jgi:hypothetical protein